MPKRKKGTLAELLPTQMSEKKQSEKNQPRRTRRFCISTYIDHNAVERYVRRSPWVQHFAMCTHTRDVKEDGSPKDVHTHIILYTYNAHTASGIRKNFDTFSAELYMGKQEQIEHTLVQECHSVASQFRYLRHLDDPDKAQYEEIEVITDNDIYWKDLCRTNGMNDSSFNSGLQMFDDILDGVSTREMIVRYGKEYIYHSHSFKECIAEHYKESPRGCDEDMLSFLEYKQTASDFLASQSVINQEQINTFFNVLDYLHSQFQIDLNIETKGRYFK